MNVFARRRAGILLHPTSLPGSSGNGDLGPDAYRFVDFLADSGISLWQTLPLGPCHEDLSPYQCMSVHAGDFRLISLKLLVDEGWLDDASLDPGADVDAQRRARLTTAAEGFRRVADEAQRAAFVQFAADHAGWLDDYALYQALRAAHGGKPWYEWPTAVRDRQPATLKTEAGRHAAQIEQARFEQFLFYRQWTELRRYANHRGVLLFGDIPIFTAHDSADVWAQRQWFAVDAHGRPQVVAGVPPDYFSVTGQRWGNPHYRWDALREDGYSWWLQRVRSQLEMFDLVRIDHFRGFEAYWEIDAESETAVDGRWVAGPGDSFFEALKKVLPERLPLVAEDLGVITPQVTALRKRFRLPGMKILQFAFDGSRDNVYLPHNHERLCVVYTGTHDNNTTLGWYQELSQQQRERLHRYLGGSSEPMPWQLMRAAFASVARLAVVPMQDVLGLDGSHRMNVPGVAEGNWRWRFDWQQLHDEHCDRLRDWVQLYDR